MSAEEYLRIKVGFGIIGYLAGTTIIVFLLHMWVPGPALPQMLGLAILGMLGVVVALFLVVGVLAAAVLGITTAAYAVGSAAITVGARFATKGSR